MAEIVKTKPTISSCQPQCKLNGQGHRMSTVKVSIVIGKAWVYWKLECGNWRHSVSQFWWPICQYEQPLIAWRKCNVLPWGSCLTQHCWLIFNPSLLPDISLDLSLSKLLKQRYEIQPRRKWMCVLVAQSGPTLRPYRL